MGKTTDEINTAGVDDDATRKTAQIRAGIEQTRAEMSETIDALQTKLEPSRVAAEVKEKVRARASEAIDHVKENMKQATRDKADEVMTEVSDASRKATATLKTAGSRAASYARANSVPVSLIGAGIGALALYGYFTRDKPNRRWYSDYADDATSYAEQVRDSGERAVRRIRETGKTHSGMTAGIAALAAGAIIGFALPVTDKERQYLGDARERFLDRTKSWLHQAGERF